MTVNLYTSTTYVYSTDNDPLLPPRLHLACGTRHLDGWINADIRDDVGADRVFDIANGIPFDTGTINTIYFAHGLEHILPSDLPDVLDEFRRVMAPGGIIYLAVPDMGEIASLILEGVYLDRLQGPVYGRRDHPGNVHHVMFTYESLAALLHRHGFYSICRYDFTLWQPGNWDDFSRSFINGRLVSLNVKAIR